MLLYKIRVFWRPSRIDDQAAILPRLQVFDKKFRSTLHGRIDISKISLVLREGIVVEQILAQPMGTLLGSTTMNILSGEAKDVTVEPHAPALIDTEVFSSSMIARFSQNFRPVGKRLK